MTDKKGGKRRQRFSRSATDRIRLTADDLAIIRHVARYRFLRSTHLVKLMQHRPSKKLIERIGALYHAGYLERPRAQLDYYDRAGSAPLVYEIGRRGISLTCAVSGSTGSRRPYIEHELAIADVMVGLEIAARARSDVEVIDQRSLLELRAPSADRRWHFSVNARSNGRLTRLAVVPDAVFALRFKRSGRTAYFFLEVDRGTMPISRADLSQSSYRRKLLTYQLALKAGQHVERFGFQNARVLTVTTSQERVQSMLDVVSHLTRGAESGRFLFIDARSLMGGDLLTLPWLSNGARVRIDSAT